MKNIKKEDKKVQEGQSTDIPEEKPEEETGAPAGEEKEEKKGKKVFKTISKKIGKAAVYIGVGAAAVCGVWVVLGAFGGKKGESAGDGEGNSESETTETYEGEVTAE